MLRPLVILLLFGSSLAVFAASQPNLRQNQGDLTVLGMTVGSSSKRDVQAKFGKGTFFRATKGEEDDVLCYLSPNQRFALIFYFGALGGWNDVTAIAVSKVPVLPWSPKKCAKANNLPETLQFLRGLSLGSSRADLVRALGPASRRGSNAVHYNVSHSCNVKERRKDVAAEDCIEVSWVDAKFSDDVLTFVRFGRFVDQ
jgi:hypothetical protein